MDRTVKMAKKKKVSKKKVRILIVLLVGAITLLFVFCMLKGKGNNKRVKKEVKVEEKIDDYNYELDDNETLYYKELFKSLKAVLSADVLDEEKYASLVSQLFLADFFNLDNKISKNDIGGIQFIYADYQKDFEKLAKESIYHYVESNIYGDRKQELPVVSEVSIVNVEKKSVKYLDTVDEEAYVVDLSIDYEKDMGYQAAVTLTLIHHNDRLEIIEMTE